ncbi:MAG: hypothetical protein A2W23_04060 [Planctomycetes bacterium RBG_16_43_13]|nr:MAG: hypothetical protein A2W23_04060 [Planctomycetes bacterium RBG_16_43_13]
MKSNTIEKIALQIVTFTVGNEQCGINIMKVQEIIRVIGAVKVPKAPAYVGGVINLRGKIVPVIDLRKRMGKSVAEYTDSSRIIVVDTGNRLAGLVVDAVIDVINLNVNDIEACPAIDENSRSKYIRGIGRKEERLITVLNLDDLLIVSQGIL